MELADKFILGTAWYFSFLLSITCHEAAHAATSTAGGDDTAEDQVTLHPLPHIRQEPFGTVLVPLMSLFSGHPPIGWASAPHSTYWALRYPMRELATTLAGPAANLILMIVTVILIQCGLLFGVFENPDTIKFTQVITSSDPHYDAPAFLLSVLFSMNLSLFVFNLLPFPPLDGFGVMRHLLSDQRRAQLDELRTQSWVLIVGLILASMIMQRVIPVIFGWTINVIFPWVTYS